MKIMNESEILSQEFRKKVIDEINGSENQSRKDEAFKRYMCFKDQTDRYVAEQLIRQFEASTVDEMSYAITDVSVTKKIINKLARVYNAGVKRTVTNKEGKELEDETKSLEEQAKILNMNTQMKKANKYLKLQRNVALHPCPTPVQTPSGEKYKITLKVLQPYLYDVIENHYDREQPMVLILSNYKIKTAMKASLDPAKEGRGFNTVNLKPVGDGKDQKIADSPADQDAEKEEYIWWSGSYHFTTNGKGEIISGESMINPIRELPFVTMAIEQDGSFWAIGGDDIVDGGILINSMLTNVNHIGVIQGYGQFWMKGENLPTSVKVGPTRVVRMEYTKESVEPDLGFASAQAPLGDLLRQIEATLALILTTNNLSTSGVSSQLSGGRDFASGIAIILDKAESTEDVQEQEQLFHDAEPSLWRKIQKWEEIYDAQGLLVDELKSQPIPPDPAVSLKFGDPQPIMSETEKLTNIEKRKDIGLNTEVELLMLDDPNLTVEQAEQRLIKIKEERTARAEEAVINEGDEGDGDPNQDDDDDRPGFGGGKSVDKEKDSV